MISHDIPVNIHHWQSLVVEVDRLFIPAPACGNARGGEELSFVEAFHALCARSLQAKSFGCGANIGDGLSTAPALFVSW